MSIDINFYNLFGTILVSFFCGFIIGIERTRVAAQYGARDHIFFSLISTSLIILYEDFLPDISIIFIIIIFSGMIGFLLIGSVYRLFRTDNPGYTSTLSMILALTTGVMSYYNPFLAIAISVIFLIILATKKQFYKVKKLKDIEWTGTVEFIAIVVLLYILIPDNIFIASINIKEIIIIFITILAIKYFSYFILKSSVKNNLYYISLLGGFAHSEATTVQLSQVGASPTSIWLLIQTMLVRMLFILLIGARVILWYALFPIVTTSAVGLIISFYILKNKETRLEMDKIKNPLSIKSALAFAGTYLLSVLVTLGLETFTFTLFNLPIYWYFIIAFIIGLLSGGASSLFVATAFNVNLVSLPGALIMLCIGLSAAIINKIFYSLKFLNRVGSRKKYGFKLLFYQSVTIVLLAVLTWLILLII
ncbi:MAG: DUF4010 domain-containing protein [Candidatus Lokiarchaeota archaeon]